MISIVFWPSNNDNVCVKVFVLVLKLKVGIKEPFKRTLTWLGDSMFEIIALISTVEFEAFTGFPSGVKTEIIGFRQATSGFLNKIVVLALCVPDAFDPVTISVLFPKFNDALNVISPFCGLKLYAV